MQPKRKLQRKHSYDYSQPGYYAVTICTQNRSCLFGVIDNGEMLLNDAGRMIAKTWHEIPDHYPGVKLDVMQIMPNHLHGIIVVREVGTDPRVCPPPPHHPQVSDLKSQIPAPLVGATPRVIPAQSPPSTPIGSETRNPHIHMFVDRIPVGGNRCRESGNW